MNDYVTIICPKCGQDVLTGAFENIGVSHLECRNCGERFSFKKALAQSLTRAQPVFDDES